MLAEMVMHFLCCPVGRMTYSTRWKHCQVVETIRTMTMTSVRAEIAERDLIDEFVQEVEGRMAEIDKWEMTLTERESLVKFVL
jgi:hypothetical protein